ncbi:gamma-glutamylcyclotransferase [Filobacillus milosensis]|uniref:Gamma-glutamylcyclotransferase family protein n=1 Tax=Filobacillus milosensis TaxID=94137 RepID=A0A4Y8IGH1_9BACI|nr:gamma-glutamylcyclotransferase [Filobacillus milosensis]TFB14131.1 gamma-glutamylcyclotransferase [Filobacillus milosensis]
MDKYLVFVYGTLRKNERNHHLLKDAMLIAEHGWIDGRLIDTGKDFPALVMDSDEKVYGECYEVDFSTLAKIDELEGYVGDPKLNHYDRVEVQVQTDCGEYKAYTYFYPEAASNPVIPFGDWRLKKLLEHENLLYFAYGSCMDHERIELAGMLDQFEAAGLGILPDHELRFTISVEDGGRADIVECHGHQVEGVVYKISEQALNYLYQREGAHTGMYRPAVVDVEMDGETVPMLTFIVIAKMVEAAPPDHYINEILRGGSVFLTKKYLTSLDERVKRLRAEE